MGLTDRQTFLRHLSRLHPERSKVSLQRGSKYSPDNTEIQNVGQKFDVIINKSVEFNLGSNGDIAHTAYLGG